MIVLMISRTLNRFLSSAAIAAHKAPASAAAISESTIVNHPNDRGRKRLTVVPATAPARSCPSAPMLNTPPRNAKATASPARINGVALTSASATSESSASNLMLRGLNSQKHPANLFLVWPDRLPFLFPHDNY